MPKVTEPITSGTFVDPGGAMAVKMLGKSDAIIRPTFCDTANPVTRIRIGNCSWKKVANVAFHIWNRMPWTRMTMTNTRNRFFCSIANR